jgi:tetratricopeptide (TPR) repeat protein
LIGNQQWDSYDPRKPLHEYMGIYVAKADDGADFGIASHGHRLGLSACAKDEKLTCTTCHNPHKRSTAKTYRLACMSCHKVEDCGDGKGRNHGSDCIACHMRKDGTSDIPHVSFTDHYIRKKPFENKSEKEPKALELVDIYGAKRSEDDSLKPIRLALAHYDVWINFRSPRSEEHAQEARKLFEKTLEGHPDHVRSLHALGTLYLKHGDPATAITHLDRANALQPKNGMLKLDLGNALARAGNLSRAAQIFKEATTLRENFRDAWVNLGNVYQDASNLEGALEAYEKADEIAPHFAMSAYNRGMGSMKRGASRSARRWFDETIRRDPLQIEAYLRLGMLELEMKRFPVVHDLASRILKIDKNYAAAYWLRGEALIGAAYYEDAITDFTKLIELAPDMEDGYIKLARAHRALKNGAAAREAIQQAITQFGRTPALKAALQELARPNEKMPWEP